MKKIIPLFLLCLIPALWSCNSSQLQEPEKLIKDETYSLQNIRFFLDSGDGIVDTTWYKLTPVSFVNNTSTEQSEITIFPYEHIKDGYMLEFNDSGIKILLEDSISIPYTILDNKLYYNDKYGPKIDEIPCNIILDSRRSADSFQFKLNPWTKVTHTGEYFIETLTASFKAECTGNQTGETVFVTGKWKASKVSNETIEGKNPNDIRFEDIK